jgi:hypothetical protein
MRTKRRRRRRRTCAGSVGTRETGRTRSGTRARVAGASSTCIRIAFCSGSITVTLVSARFSLSLSDRFEIRYFFFFFGYFCSNFVNIGGFRVCFVLFLFLIFD